MKNKLLVVARGRDWTISSPSTVWPKPSDNRFVHNDAASERKIMWSILVMKLIIVMMMIQSIWLMGFAQKNLVIIVVMIAIIVIIITILMIIAIIMDITIS